MDTPDIASAVLLDQAHVRLPSRPDWIEAVAEFVKRKAVLSGACQESRAGKLMVAMHEAFSNAIIHGNLELSSELKERGDDSFAEALAAKMGDAVLASRHVDLVVDYDGQRCQWTITDQGRGFDVVNTLARAESDDPEVLLSSGRGILIMRSFLDEVRYELGGRRLVLTMLRASGAEKRRQDRHTYHQALQIVPVAEDGSVDWEAAYEAVARNISRDGMNLLQEQLATTSRVMIGLPAGNRLIYLPAEIRHWQSLTSGVVELGCRFVAGEGSAGAAAGNVGAVQEAVEPLLDSLKQPSLPSQERRGDQRLPYHGRIEIRAEGKPPLVGFARNLSRGGIGFLSTVALPFEERTIWLPQAGGRPLGLRAHIKRCVKIKKELYDVGAGFIDVEGGAP